MRSHLHDEVEVARRAARAAAPALARHTHTRAVGDPGGDLHRQLLALLDDAGAGARRACFPADASRALARRAHRRAPHGHGGRDAAERVEQVDVDVMLEVLPRFGVLGRRTRALTEDVVQDVGEAATLTPPGAKRAEVERAVVGAVEALCAAALEAAALLPALELTRASRVEPRLQPLVAELVVELPLLGVAEDVVRIGDVLELLLRLLVPRIDVRVMLPGQLAVRLPDVVRAGVTWHPEGGIQILGFGHQPPARSLVIVDADLSSATSRSAVTMSLLSDSTSGRAPFNSCFARRAASSTSSKRFGTRSRQSSTVIRAMAGQPIGNAC
jgi:hypothetical protein